MRVLAAALLLAAACTAPAQPSTVPSVTPASSLAARTETPPASDAPQAIVVAPSPAPTATPAAVPQCRQPVGKAPPGAPEQLIALCPDGAVLWVDTSLSPADVSGIARQVVEDLAAVQREFAWTLRTRAVIYVRATRDGYIDTLRSVFGYGAATADYVADNSVAFFEPSLRTIAVNWEEVRDRRPIAAIRHELTHVVTLEACAPRCDLVPAWLNEGEARLMETTVGADWRMMRVRYEAISMAATSTLLPLTSLWTQGQWNAYGDWLGYYKYQEAARAAQFLRDDIGRDAMPRLYAQIRAGRDVPTAYAALSGRSFATFTAGLESRIRGDDPPRGIATSTPGADGTGVGFLVYGFPAESKVTVRIRSHAIDETQLIDASPQGAWFGAIDQSYPQGVYTITAASGDAVAAVTVTKRGGRVRRAARD